MCLPAEASRIVCTPAAEPAPKAKAKAKAGRRRAPAPLHRRGRPGRRGTHKHLPAVPAVRHRGQSGRVLGRKSPFDAPGRGGDGSTAADDVAAAVAAHVWRICMRARCASAHVVRARSPRVLRCVRRRGRELSIGLQDNVRYTSPASLPQSLVAPPPALAPEDPDMW